MNIAIDGPSGAGKSTVAKLLAKELGITYLDTGAMYRALALKASDNGISPSDEQAVFAMMQDTVIDVRAGENGSVVLLDGVDVSDRIREHKISAMASDISALLCVREFLVSLQQKIAASKDSVLDGRDIGTVVLPKAEFKFYLTASPDVRADRRFLELTAKGENANRDKIKEDIIKRDYNDMHRQHSPLKKAEDAIEIDSDDMTAEQVKEAMLHIIRNGK